MKRYCPRCSNQGSEVPEYSLQQKRALHHLKVSKKSSELMMKIKSLHNLSLMDTKFIYMHINEKYGKCNRCNVDYLKEEYVHCPKCKALNFNWNV